MAHYFKFRFQHIFLLLSGAMLIALLFLVLHKKESCPYSFIPMHSFKEALPLFSQCTDKDIFFFDIDDTLIMGVDGATRVSYPLSFKLKLILRHPQLIIPSTWEYYNSILWEQSKRCLIEPEIIDSLALLKKRDCTVLGLTSMETGSYGIIKNFPQWRIDMLNNFGLKFSLTYHDVIFDALPSYRNNHPALYKGVLFCNQQPKGIVVGAFLDAYKLHPSKIIFFDDDQENLRSVADECAKRLIPFIGFLYLKKHDLPGKWDEERALMQFGYLLKHQKWLRDDLVLHRFSPGK